MSLSYVFMLSTKVPRYHGEKTDKKIMSAINKSKPIAQKLKITSFFNFNFKVIYLSTMITNILVVGIQL